MVLSRANESTRALHPRPWFRARANGLGWTPITWQGWLVTLLSAAVVVAANLALLARVGAFRR
jgi:hypothetical protein